MEKEKAEEKAEEKEVEKAEEKEVEKAEEKYRERLIRLQAEYDNFRKNMEKRFDEERKLASEKLVLKLLNVIDDLERVLKNMKKEEKEGIEMIYKNMMSALKSEGVERIDCAEKPFDPFEQEAVEISYEGPYKENTVIEELRAGYKMNGRVIRTALVKVKGGKK